jgi:hypothetical protein
MSDHDREIRLARLTGVLLLVMSAGAIVAELVDAGTPSGLWTGGLIGFLVAYLCDVPVAVLLHTLFRHVDRTVSLLSMAFRLVYTGIVGACLVPYIAGLHVVSGEEYLAAFGSEQLDAFAQLGANLFHQGFAMALVFFSFHLMTLGWLMLRSGRVHTAIAVLIGVGGVSYLVDNVLFFVAPELDATLKPMFVLLGMAEIVLALYFVIRGIRPRP